MVDRSICDNTDGLVRYPLPENDVFAVNMRLDLFLRVNIEDP
jgi:hypothetical protein